jgi:hypothetical protein
VTAVPDEQVGRYGCPLCRLRFPSLPDKKLHLQDRHPEYGAKKAKR